MPLGSWSLTFIIQKGPAGSSAGVLCQYRVHMWPTTTTGPTSIMLGTGPDASNASCAADVADLYTFRAA